MGEPSKTWLDMLGHQGLAITIVMFLLVVVLPPIGWGAWRVGRWIGERIDRLLDKHMNYLDVTGEATSKLVTAAEQSANTQSEVKEMIARIVTTDTTWHDEKLKRLDAIHGKVTEVHEDVKTIKGWGRPG